MAELSKDVQEILQESVKVFYERMQSILEMYAENIEEADELFVDDPFWQKVKPRIIPYNYDEDILITFSKKSEYIITREKDIATGMATGISHGLTADFERMLDIITQSRFDKLREKALKNS